MKRLMIFFAIVFFSMSVFGVKLATLPELVKPDFMTMDDRQLYVAEKTTVYIYSLKDYKLKAKFGRTGEGPQEFLEGPGPLAIFLLKDSILILSQGKMSYFSKDGKYIKETKISSRQGYQPIGDKYVGVGFTQGPDSISFSWNLYDSKLDKIKELTSGATIKYTQFEFPIEAPNCVTKDNRIIADSGKKGISLILFDANGNKTGAINRDVEAIKVSENYKTKVFEFFQKTPQTKPFFEEIKKRTKFKDYFPAVCPPVVLDNNTIYVFTYKEKNGNRECLVFDINGKLLKQTFVPLDHQNVFLPPIMSIKKGKLYQIIENDDTEEWELHSVDIK